MEKEAEEEERQPERVNDPFDYVEPAAVAEIEEGALLALAVAVNAFVDEDEEEVEQID